MMKYCVFVVLLCLSTISHATQLNKIVVFGDSLSDNGNLYQYMKQKFPPSPPYYQGRFSNGPIWVEHLTQAYYGTDWRAHLLDYAFGGAGVENDEDDDSLFSLNREIDSYLLAHQNQADASTLFIVWIGVNNYLYTLDLDNQNDTVQAVNAGIKADLKRLVDRGAKHILVINLPDLSKSPAARDFDLAQPLSYCTRMHNLALQNNLQQLKDDYSTVQWLSFDANALVQVILDNPAAFGFVNITDTCLQAKVEDPSTSSVLKMVATIQSREKGRPVCAGYLFFDQVHPTESAHKIMAQQIGHLLESVDIHFE